VEAKKHKKQKLKNLRTRSHKLQVFKYNLGKSASYIALSIALISLVSVIAFVLIRGIPYLNMHLLFGEYQPGNPSIKPALIGTGYLIAIALSIAAPIGIGCAIFLTEYANSTSRAIRVIRVATETLAGIPSIVYGIFGFVVFVRALNLGHSLLGGGLTLAIMVLPVIVRSTEESLLSVPRSLREGSFALGSSHVRTIFSVVLPCAASGIVTSLILAAGRVIAESAALLVTIGMVANHIPENIFSPGTSLALSVFFYGSHGHPNVAAATGVVLLVIVVSVNIVATVLGKIFGKGELANG